MINWVGWVATAVFAVSSSTENAPHRAGNRRADVGNLRISRRRDAHGCGERDRCSRRGIFIVRPGSERASNVVPQQIRALLSMLHCMDIPPECVQTPSHCEHAHRIGCPAPF